VSITGDQTDFGPVYLSLMLVPREASQLFEGAAQCAGGSGCLLKPGAVV
jgi:hypothetical protein